MYICDYKTECTGCAACANICPTHSISMKLNEEGFLEPRIDISTCINCGKCIRNCPSKNQNNTNFSLNDIRAFSFTRNDSQVLKESSSGGAFSTIANEIIERGGVVFGAAFNERFDVVHIGIDTVEGLNSLRGSKYVESDTKLTYSEAKQYLQSGRLVLYVGTPCQVAGLYATLDHKKYDNLFTIDLLCHGVPSISLFRAYLDDINKRYGKIVSYSFRDKTKYGWGNWGSFTYLDSKIRKHKRYFVVANDYFYSLFFKECNLRECCYNCKYATVPRVGDITLGDCWGIEDLSPQAYTNRGVSLVLVNNDKGISLISKLNINGELFTLDAQATTKYNKTIIQPTSRPKARATFYSDFAKYGFVDTAKQYCKLKHITPIIARHLPRGLKNRIKKMLKRWT